MIKTYFYRIRPFARLLLAVVMLLLFKGCSWQQNFAVINATDQPVWVTYRVSSVTTGQFPIFTGNYTLYALTGKGNINWEKRTKMAAEQGSNKDVHLTLPPGQAMVFGRLSNDDYQHRGQQFINGRVFNFQHMSIAGKEGEKTEIPAAQFDDFFKNEGNTISYRVQ